jgi:transposase
MELLKTWRLSSNRRLWERAAALEAMNRGDTLDRICGKIDRSRKTILQWLALYNAKGLTALTVPRRRVVAGSLERIKEREERLLKLIHEASTAYGINRSSWSLKSLVEAYVSKYKAPVCATTVSDFFKKSGFQFKKAKTVLTSPDPDFRAKLDVIKETLSKLKQTERFFQ